MERILVPIDFSPESTTMLEVAANEAKLRKATITLLHIVETITAQPLEMLPSVVPEDESTLESEAADRIQQIIAEHFQGIECEAKIRRGLGPIASEIVSFENEKKFTLIVISTHSRTFFERLFLANTSSKVIGSAKCPVLVVPV